MENANSIAFITTALIFLLYADLEKEPPPQRARADFSETLATLR